MSFLFIISDVIVLTGDVVMVGVCGVVVAAVVFGVLVVVAVVVVLLVFWCCCCCFCGLSVSPGGESRDWNGLDNRVLRYLQHCGRSCIQLSIVGTVERY